MKTDREIALAWVRIQKDWWAFDNVHDSVRDRPRRAWRLLDALTRLATTPMLVRDLGCGPLEDFVRLHAPAFIRQIERRCAENSRFRRALSHAWLPRATDDISIRLLALGIKPIDTKLAAWQAK
jgi:uncharacterized protein DUF6869